MPNLDKKKLLETCISNNKSLTYTRALVIKTLAKHDRPRSAYDLRTEINKRKKSNINISTIYRVLDFWVSLNQVHKLKTINKYLLCKKPTSKHIHMINFCTSCERVFEICDEKIDLNIKESTDKLSLSVDGPYCIEVPVICSNCN